MSDLREAGQGEEAQLRPQGKRRKQGRGGEVQRDPSWESLLPALSISTRITQPHNHTTAPSRTAPSRHLRTVPAILPPRGGEAPGTSSGPSLPSPQSEIRTCGFSDQRDRPEGGCSAEHGIWVRPWVLELLRVWLRAPVGRQGCE